MMMWLLLGRRTELLLALPLATARGGGTGNGSGQRGRRRWHLVSENAGDLGAEQREIRLIATQVLDRFATLLDRLEQVVIAELRIALQRSAEHGALVLEALAPPPRCLLCERGGGDDGRIRAWLRGRGRRRRRLLTQKVHLHAAGIGIERIRHTPLDLGHLLLGVVVHLLVVELQALLGGERRIALRFGASVR